MIAGIQPSLPAISSIGAGVILLAIVWWGWPFQRYPGAKTWSLILITVAIWDISYGIALTVFDPHYRWYFEIPVLFGRTFSIPLILIFALQYTGREELVGSTWLSALIGIFVGGFVLAITNPWHHLMWTEYHISPIMGAAAVRYTPRFYYVIAGMSYMLILIAVALFADTIARYRSVYGRQIIAIIIALIVPTVANLLWMFRLGPTRHLDLTPGGHLVAGSLLTYALFREGMFEIVPATRHKAEQAALDDLASGVISITNDGLVVNINTRALEWFDVDRDRALLEPIQDFIDIRVPPKQNTFTLSNPLGRRNEYAVAISEITSNQGNTIGYTISLQDITTERLRQQRLEVLNRILRHNLRNDLNVVELLLENIETNTDNASEDTERIRRKVRQLMTLGEKAHSIERIIANEENGSEIGLAEVIRISINEAEMNGNCSIQNDIGETDIEVNASLLEPILRELIENGCLHNDTENPTVRIDATVDTTSELPITITIRDNGPGIPEHEIAPIEDGTETPLEHGSGLGLWLVHWGVSVLNGQIEFSENDPRGAIVTLRLPAAE